MIFDTVVSQVNSNFEGVMNNAGFSHSFTVYVFGIMYQGVWYLTLWDTKLIEIVFKNWKIHFCLLEHASFHYKLQRHLVNDVEDNNYYHSKRWLQSAFTVRIIQNTFIFCGQSEDFPEC